MVSNEGDRPGDTKPEVWSPSSRPSATRSTRRA